MWIMLCNYDNNSKKYSIPVKNVHFLTKAKNTKPVTHVCSEHFKALITQQERVIFKK